MSLMRFKDAAKHVKYVLDDAGMAEPLGANQHAKVRYSKAQRITGEYHHASRLLCWVTDPIKPFVIAVHSYGDWYLSDDEVTEIALDWLKEKGYFGDLGPIKPDLII